LSAIGGVVFFRDIIENQTYPAGFAIVTPKLFRPRAKARKGKEGSSHLVRFRELGIGRVAVC